MNITSAKATEMEVLDRAKYARRIAQEREWVTIGRSLDLLIEAHKKGTYEQALGAIRHLSNAIILTESLVLVRAKHPKGVPYSIAFATASNLVLLAVADMHQPRNGSKHAEAIDLFDLYAHDDPFAAAERAKKYLKSIGALR